MRKPFANTIVLAVLLTLAAGCGPTAPTAAPVSPAASPVPATPMPPTATPIPPTATPVPPTAVPAAPPGALTVTVPLGNAPTLDGTLSPGEWDSARREEFSDGSELLLMQDGGYLYLGIQAHIQNVCVWSVFFDRGDEIAVLHSSAALGTAVYERTGSGWQRTRAFAWTLRGTSNSETARQQRRQFLEKEGWLASLGTMGKPEEAEFQLAMPQGTLRLAVAFLLPPGFDKAALWPAGVDDDGGNIDLLRGDAPAQARFSPEGWAVVMVDGSESAGPALTPVSEATPIPLDGRGGGVIAFYSERDGNAEIYTINADGSAETRLTDNHALDIVPDLSPDGSQIVFVSDRDGNEEIYRMNWDGSNVVRLTNAPAKDSYPYWSSDGTRIVFCSQRDDGRTYEVYVMQSDGADQTRITRNSVSEEWAYLSPDMQKIVYAVGPFPRYSLYVMNVDGSDPHQIFSSDKAAAFPKWSRDGKTIACNHATLSAGHIVGDVCLVNADGSDLRQITQSAANAVSENPYWSPDGRRIVFQSNRTGNFQIYAMNADGSNQVRLTNHRGNDYWPSWGPAPDSGLYLGQTPPGLDVEVFAPGIVSVEDGKEYNIAISPDLQEIFFTRRTPGGRDDRIWTSRLEGGKLTVPELAPFAHDLLETDACFTPDGNRLYFNSARPLPGEETASPLPNVWFVDRTETGWSEPQFVGPPLSDYHPVYFSIANDGTLYFTRSSPRGIYYAEPEDGRYLEAHRLPDEINYVRDVAHPAVAPDESYIIVNSSYEHGGRLVGSLYISFRKPDGSWTRAVSMHNALQASEADVYAIPRITPDGRYLFFERYEAETDRSDIYWVSTAVVEPLRPH